MVEKLVKATTVGIMSVKPKFKLGDMVIFAKVYSRRILSGKIVSVHSHKHVFSSCKPGMLRVRVDTSYAIQTGRRTIETIPEEAVSTDRKEIRKILDEKSKEAVRQCMFTIRNMLENLNGIPKKNMTKPQLEFYKKLKEAYLQNEKII